LEIRNASASADFCCELWVGFVVRRQRPLIYYYYLQEIPLNSYNFRLPLELDLHLRFFDGFNARNDGLASYSF